MIDPKDIGRHQVHQEPQLPRRTRRRLYRALDEHREGAAGDEGAARGGLARGGSRGTARRGVLRYSATIASGPSRRAVGRTTPRPVVKRDTKAAKAKLTEGGQPNGFKMVLKGDNTPLTAKIAQLVQAQLKEVGITVEIQVLEFGALLKAGEQNDFDALSLGWSGRIDPDGNIEPIFQTKGAFNYGKYSSPDVDNLVAQARQVADQGQRKAIYQQLTKKINDDVAYIFTRFTPSNSRRGTTSKASRSRRTVWRATRRHG